jgi:transposase
LASIALSYRIPPNEFEKQYKDHLSDFRTWDQKDHAEEWLLFPQNIGAHLSIDETALSNGELYTLVTNKKAHGKKGALLACVRGTKTADVTAVLSRIDPVARNLVSEVTLDLSPAMEATVRSAFPRARVISDRFHVQKLVSEAVQELRVALRRDAQREENEAIKRARADKRPYAPHLYANGDTKKQLLARSKHLLFMPKSRWHDSQKKRAKILFTAFPTLRKAYDLSMMFRSFYEHPNDPATAHARLEAWYAKIASCDIDSFLLPAETVRVHEETILNYFVNRSTNADAESFNAKLKNFRALLRGVSDKKFFLFRVAKLYA